MRYLRMYFTIAVLLCIAFPLFGLHESFENPTSNTFLTELWKTVDKGTAADPQWQIITDFGAPDGTEVAMCEYLPISGIAVLKMHCQVTFYQAGTVRFNYTQRTAGGDQGLLFKINNGIGDDQVLTDYRPVVGWYPPGNEPEFDILTPGTYTLKWQWVTKFNNTGSYVRVDDIVFTGTTLADAGGPYYVVQGKTLQMDASVGSSAIWYDWVQSDATGYDVTLMQGDGPTPYFVAPSGLTSEVNLTFDLTVDNELTDTADVYVGDHPTADAGADQTVDEGDTGIVLDGINSAALSVPWHTGLAYSWQQIAGDFALNVTGDDTNQLTFDAPLDIGDTSVDMVFRLTVTNIYGGTANDSVTVRVFDPASPIADAGADQSVDLGTAAVAVNGGGSTERGGAAYTYTWTPISEDAIALALPVFPYTGTTFNFAVPAVMGEYEYEFELELMNGSGTADTDRVIINATTPPIADAGEDFKANESNNPVVLDGTDSYDPDGEFLTYTWTQTGGPAVPLLNADTATPRFTYDTAGTSTLTFQLLVDDGKGKTDTDSVTVTLNDDTTPQARAGDDYKIFETATGQLLNGAGSRNALGTFSGLTYTWVQTAGTAASNITGASTSQMRFDAPDIADGTTETLTFQLTVLYGGVPDTDTVDIIVIGTNYPFADAGADRTFGENGVATLNGSGSFDADSPLTYLWTRLAGPPEFDFTGVDFTLESPTFNVGPLDNTVVFVFQLTVTGGAQNDTDTVTITLRNGGLGGSGGDTAGCSFGERGNTLSLLPFLLAGLMFMLYRKLRK